MAANFSWSGDAGGVKFFHLDGHLQAIRGSEAGCTCAAEAKGQSLVPWPGSTTCTHATTLRAVAALGVPEGSRDFVGDE